MDSWQDPSPAPHRLTRRDREIDRHARTISLEAMRQNIARAFRPPTSPSMQRLEVHRRACPTRVLFGHAKGSSRWIWPVVAASMRGVSGRPPPCYHGEVRIGFWGTWGLVLAACHSRAAPEDTRAAVVASAELGPPKKPPKLRAPRAALPALPDLPALGAHESA